MTGSACPPVQAIPQLQAMVGTAQVRVCPPYEAKLGAISPRKPRLAHRSLPSGPQPAGCSNRHPPCRLLSAGSKKGPPPIWRVQIRETGNVMTELRYMAPATLDQPTGAFAAA